MNEKKKWVRVSRRHRCPICGHADFCTVAADGRSAHCMRIESPHPCPGNLGGWFHDVSDDRAVAPPPVAAEPVAKLTNVDEIARKMFSHREATRVRRDLARRWNVRVTVLERMLVGVGWSERGSEFISFPSVDGDGKIVGITRRFSDGKKLTLRGTSNGGIFAPEGWQEPGGWVWVVEGASDTAVLAHAGLRVLGRPSNVGGIAPLLKMIAAHCQDAKIVVVGENDRKPDRPGTAQSCPKDCPGCPWCFPGRFGALEVASRLKAWRVIMPPVGVKDAREWYERVDVGLAADMIEAVALRSIAR